ncbi:MAG: hypothetical protein KatS3mg045_0031 [Bellilinea sp.]|nr:MAG: hypothetical protein KatS3mg045_0031 [Bellilinea sp.]
METLITFLRLVLLSMVPFVLASQGTMLGGRTGIFNVAQEGIMLLGASLGFLVSYQVGNNFVGMLAAMAAGAVFGLLLAYFTTTLKMNQFVIGLSLFFIGVGLSTLLPKLIIGITLSPPLIPTLPEVSIPLLSQIPLLGPILFQQNGLVYFSILLSLVLWYFLYRTQRGLELRAVGENPMTADSLGINVVRARYWTAILGGALIGLAGAYLPMVYTGTFTEAMTRGTRLAGNCADLLRRMEPTHHSDRFVILCRRGGAGLPRPGHWAGLALSVPVDGAVPRHHPDHDPDLP